MNRSEFVVGYISKTQNRMYPVYCLACKIYKGLSTNGRCAGMICSDELFDNTKHIPIITQKECTFNECNLPNCNNCVMSLKFGVRRK